MKKLLIYIGLVAGTLALPGCKKYLETLPDNRAVITTPEQVSQLLATAYPHGTYMLFCEALSDNVEDKGNTGVGIDLQTFLINSQVFKYEDPQAITPDSPVAYWDSCYAAIAAANQALSYCNGPDSANFSAQKGEALVCRAYAHFMLVTLFSKAYNPATAASDPGIPYMTAVSKNVFTKYNRGTVADVYKQIENDLTTGMPLIQDRIYGDAPKFHFSAQAANAFASRFYLFKRDYAKVVTYANAVFGRANPASLIRNQVAVYGMSYNDMVTQYTSSSNPANILLQEAPDSKYMDNYYSYRYGIGTKLNQDVFNAPNVTNGFYAISIYGASPQYFNFPKFTNALKIQPLLGMEEVLMNRAEANVHLKNYAAAIADLNIWISKNITRYDPNLHNVDAAKMMNFYGLPQDESMIATALDFKRVTYFQEGLRWLDIKRLDIPVVHTGANNYSTTLVPGDKRRLLQLPLEAVNDGMALNPR
ncbi:MAG: RagB/SusD family nutrient uptake outer membrane protein [Chitinophaga sp.]|uniref:RagB/SusD family nutrient uptake outer membrane protein n=1 Tax=Chitinophaga sp. TaxID=1869181 RepID=UPI001AFDEC38|nr:RagB/SusD family nutrient uptake outer membrane protein [Chitinophaga sp.]MBO9727365.1 RagB/SusD family nutrient uptake outer membrane protein [Chitinophaga sp.]